MLDVDTEREIEARAVRCGADKALIPRYTEMQREAILADRARIWAKLAGIKCACLCDEIRAAVNGEKPE